MDKAVLITGIMGQEGAYLAEHRLEPGYIVHVAKRRSFMFNTDGIDGLYQDPHDHQPALCFTSRRPVGFK